MKRESKTQYALLGILSQCEMNGYEIKKFIEGSLSFFWNESFGQIYPTLKELSNQGLVALVDNNLSDSKKTNLPYKITKQGQIELKKWLEGKTAQPVLRKEFLLKLFFARNIDPKILKVKISEQEEITKDELKLFRKIKSDISMHNSKHPDFKYWNFTLDYAIENAKMNLKWLSKIKKES
ncbi:MAG: PadR family transcriptional regulator [Leptospiraceae bacterium]|nr:PadR family transcriptional regulator [Leptospiraceae bacterium]MCZ8346356.1 PadR family transcriptional regulator [Leptospiraceae bacterium]